MANVVLKDKQDRPKIYSGVEKVSILTEAGTPTVFISENKIDEMTAEKLSELTVNEDGVYTPTAPNIGFKKVTVTVDNSGSSNIVNGGYTVKFVVKDSLYAVLSVTAGQSLNSPTVPKASGQYFTGWFTEAIEGQKISFPYKPTADITVYAHFSEQVIVGITGLDNDDDILTLTDDIAGLEGYTEQQAGDYVSVSSPLSEYFPFNEIEEYTDEFGNAFVKFPKIWMKWLNNTEGDISGYKFSNCQADDEFFVPDAFLNPKYVTTDEYLPYFALGKYEMSLTNNKGFSKSGTNVNLLTSRDTARYCARAAYGDASNLYNGYQMIDYSQLIVYNLLCMMFFQHSNIQYVYGGRTGSGTVPSWDKASITGTCDGVSGMNGWNVATDCVKMLGVENPYGNIDKWVDGILLAGINSSSDQCQIIRYPQFFQDKYSPDHSLPLVTYGYGVDDYLKNIGISSNDKTKSYIVVRGLKDYYTGAFGDYLYFQAPSGKYGVAISGGGYSDKGKAGLWNLTLKPTIGEKVDAGSRLAYRPINDALTTN